MSDSSAVGSCVTFRCKWAREAGAELCAVLDEVRVVCIGRIPAGLIMQAIERGAGRVLVVGCPESDCRHHNGVKLARAQVRVARDLLHLLGLDPDRVQLVAGNESRTARSAAHPGE
jgi:coenzyme F420-reducing hydrogenase delta subunit